MDDDRRQSPLGILLGFLLAPLVASLAFSVLIFGSPIWTWLVALVAVPLALLLGLPLFLVGRLWREPTLPACVIGGWAVVAAPALAVLLSQEVPWDASAFGFVTAVTKQRTIAGWAMLVLMAAWLGCFGAFGGAVFWMIAKLGSPERTR